MLCPPPSTASQPCSSSPCLATLMTFKLAGISCTSHARAPHITCTYTHAHSVYSCISSKLLAFGSNYFNKLSLSLHIYRKKILHVLKSFTSFVKSLVRNSLAMKRYVGRQCSWTPKGHLTLSSDGCTRKKKKMDFRQA